MLHVSWLLKWLHILIIINFNPYNNERYSYQYLRLKTTCELDNLGNCLSNSLVTVEGLELLTNDPWCGSDQLSKIPSIGHQCI